MKDKWNKRYSSEEYFFGKEPNDFLKEQIEKIKPGNALFLGEGEGRNSVYAATLGWDVDAIDVSDVGKEKAITLAEENDTSINYIIDDVFTRDYCNKKYDAVVLIYFHIPKDRRDSFYPQILDSLKEGGALIQLVYDEEHLKHNSNGPSDINMLYTLEEIAELFIDLEFVKFQKETFTRTTFGQGEQATVIKFVGKK